MTPEAWFATGVVVAVFAALALTRHPPYLILMGGLTLLLASGIVDPATALSGFANTGVVTVGVLFVVAAGLSQTGVLAIVLQRVLGRTRSSTVAQARLAGPVLLGSAFLNNTPIVAMLLPAVMNWCRRTGVSPSKMLLPLSYTAILGGLCTLIGTSTNLVVNGMMVSEGLPSLGLFDIAWVGVPAAIAGFLFMLVIGRRLLPDLDSDDIIPEDPREYAVEMVVSDGGPLVGLSIEEAGLRHLDGLFLIEIHRGDTVFPAVDPLQTLEAGDQLIFVGVLDRVVDLQKRPGLQLATTQVFKLNSHRAQRRFMEAVVSATCPLVGMTIREGRFRNRYNAVVIAVSRNGVRMKGRIGDIVLRPGDALLLEAHPTFAVNNRNSSDFYLISVLDRGDPPTKQQAPFAMLILGGMIISVTAGWLSMLTAAFVAAALMILTRCTSEAAARRSIDWPLLIAIAASFGIGHGLESSGAADVMAQGLIAQAGSSPWIALALVYLATTLVSSFVTNNAAAVIMFPIAVATAHSLGVNHVPFTIAMMVAASAAFATPLGYQTNLMVWGPGGYRMSDFVKIGVPMTLLVGIITVLLAPRVWPF